MKQDLRQGAMASRETEFARTASLTIDQLLREAGRAMAKEGIDTAHLDARLLLSEVTGFSSAQLIARGKEVLPPHQMRRFTRLISRRMTREPVSRIVGYREFYGRRFSISPATLDPRPDSETLIDAVLAIVAKEKLHDRPLRILDVGTGSGCLLLTLLAELPAASGLGTDICHDALGIAKKNAQKLGLASRAKFQQTRSMTGIGGTFDFLISNPPYIPTGDIATLAPEVAQFDPHDALDGGDDGLSIYRELATRVNQVIPDGWVLFEVGAGLSRPVADLLLSAIPGAEPQKCHILRDLTGRERVVTIRTL